MDSKYVPGVCNIGEAEIRRRKMTGCAGLAVTIILLAVLVSFNLPHLWRLVLFIPSMMAAMGYLQARMHFCAYFAVLGIFNFGDDSSKRDTIQQAEFRAKDRRKALQIIAYSVIIGILVAAGAFYLPI